MDLKIQIKLNEELQQSKEVVERLLGENLENKMASYLKKYSGEDIEKSIDLKLEKNKSGLYNGILHANLNGEVFRYEREDYKNLDDLINNLFDHFKESLSAK